MSDNLLNSVWLNSAVSIVTSLASSLKSVLVRQQLVGCLLLPLIPVAHAVVEINVRNNETNHGENRPNQPANEYACPAGTRPLSEDYPTTALVLSDFQDNLGESIWEITYFIRRIFEISKDSEPDLLLAVPQERARTIVSEVERLAPIASHQVWLDHIRPLNVPHYNWPQDFFEVFNRDNGAIFFRNVENHPRAPFQFADILPILQSHGFESLPPLNVSGSDRNDRDSSATPIGGHDGGNIEALPEGICVLGDDQFESIDLWQHYARQACGSLDKVLMAPTYWLAIGHADELTRVLPVQRKAGQCRYAIALPSHKHALSLLALQPEQDFLSSDTKTLLLKNPHAFSGADWSLPEFCARWKPAQFSDFVSDEERTKLCLSMKNKDVIEVYGSNRDLTMMAQLIDQELDEYRRRIREAIQASNANCLVEFVDLPILYMSSATTPESSQPSNWPYQRSSLTSQGTTRYLEKSLAITLLPNMAGAINLKNTVLTPDPGNDLFREDVRSQYQKFDVSIEYFDIMLTGHRGLGSLHCMTHSVHRCQPIGTTN